MSETTVPVVLSNESFIRDNVELLLSGKFSDFTIVCGQQQFKVHRAILYGNSRFYDTLIDGCFKESVEHVAHLPTDDPLVIAAVLYWIYTACYPIEIECVDSDNNVQESPCKLAENEALSALTPGQPVLSACNFTSHLRLYEIADRQMLPGLKRAAFTGVTDLYMQQGRTYWKTSPDFAEAIALLYGDFAADDEIKRSLAFALAFDIDSTDQQWSVLSHIASQVHGFAWDLLLEHECNVKRWVCVSCQKEQDFTADVMRLYLSDDGNFEWLTCHCRFRGFCSDMCKVFGSREDLTYYCTDCDLKTGQDVGCELKEDENGDIRHCETTQCTVFNSTTQEIRRKSSTSKAQK